MKNMGSKSSYSPKKENKSSFSINESNKTPIMNSKIMQSPSPIKAPSTEKYIPPNLRNKYGNNFNSNSNSNLNSFDKPIKSPNLFIGMEENIYNDFSKILYLLVKL